MVRPLDFVREQLRMNPEASFEEVRARAHMEDVKVHQTTYGRVRTELGIVPKKARPRSREEDDDQDVVRRTLTVGPNGEGPSMGSDLPADLATMVDKLRHAIVEKDRYRVVMETVLRLFQEALEPRKESEQAPEPR